MRFSVSYILATLILSQPVLADPLLPLPSIPSIAQADGWAFAFGAAVEYEALYDGADDYDVEAEPALLVQWRDGHQMWFLEGAELGWRALRGQHWLVQAGLRLEGGRDEDDADALRGLGDTDDELTAMFEVRRGFGANWNNWLGARVMAGDGDIGTLGVLAGGHYFGANAVGTGLELIAFTTFGSAAFFERDFGISAAQSEASGLAPTRFSGGYRSFGASLVGRWFPAERWQLSAELGYEKYNSDIADSPIALRDYETEVGLTVVYLF
ncbi:MipA/OmpV family protein [Exilibacterium tricleocarpae]|uniref:MipA/OmpV family protein n=1 Tax=Exilibacterium tricleocarpae TaxID=2591008 RepID=A0A545TZ79_9GAMM|nr:MipA/OmpV family protein [Exilibacterium tricleocarpae]TQV82497.1 MipA/OmpV family protein [Exilibacterium tricleocarpae]